MVQSNTKTAADWLAKVLADAGTTHVFFVDAILRKMLVKLAGVGVQQVLAHTEQAAAYMADGYARVKRSPGVCLAQSVGAANQASSLQDAWLAQSPVLALSGRKVTAAQHRNAYQEIYHDPLFAPVTKFSAHVDAADHLPRLLQQAWRSAVTGTPRPVHLDLAGLQAEFVQDGLVPSNERIDPALVQCPPYRPIPTGPEIGKAIDAIRSAKRIAILAGTGAMWSSAGDEVLELAEILKAPVTTSHGGRGIIPTKHPLSIGVMGHYAPPPTNEIVYQADLVLMIGFQAGDLSTDFWRVPASETQVVQIDIDPLEIGRSYSNTIGLAGDPKATVALLLEKLSGLSRDGSYAEDATRKFAAWQESMHALRSSNERPIRVERLCAEIERAMPSDAILVADTGNSAVWTSQLIDIGPKQTYLRAAGSLGWALPAAIGAKCAAPDRPVICFAGDGAIYYHIAELETAKRRNIPFVLVANNNSGLGQCWPGVSKLQSKDTCKVGDIITFTETDFSAVARGFGVKAIRVEDPDRIGSALAEALAAGEPVVVDVVTSFEGQPPLAWSPPAKV
ncbi:thiamine pyrophosphate-binding protein [Leptospira interrogans]